MAANQFISVAAIRLFLLDRTGADNFLLDDVDFTPEMMDLAMNLTVSEYNTTDPFVATTYTIETFPFQVPFLLGVTAWLLRSKALNMTRNSFNYTTAAGASVNDKETAATYFKLADQFKAEFLSAIRKIKTEQNITAGYGGMGSEFGLAGSW